MDGSPRSSDLKEDLLQLVCSLKQAVDTKRFWTMSTLNLNWKPLVKNFTLGYRPATIARLSTRRNQVSTSVVLSFASQEQKDKAISQGIKVGCISYNIRNYLEKPRVRVNQCRNCYSFGHPAAWCPNEIRCPCCSLAHPANECPVLEAGDYDNFKCPNCTDNRKHSATSPTCPKLKARLRTVKYD
eukprot:sb/3471433/